MFQYMSHDFDIWLHLYYDDKTKMSCLMDPPCSSVACIRTNMQVYLQRPNCIVISVLIMVKSRIKQYG